MAVHFTGPILHAGKDGNRQWFENLPASQNPDYLTYMDDFTGIALDTTNDWTLIKDSSATAALGADAEVDCSTSLKSSKCKSVLPQIGR